MRKVRKATMQPVTVASFSLDGQKTKTWGSRYPAIATILRSSGLDAYLLQEVSAPQMEELGRTLRNNYEVIHYAHPTSAGGVAVLLRKERLELVHQARLPFWAKGALPDCFMCAAIAFARDRVSGARLVIASTVRACDDPTHVRDESPPHPPSLSSVSHGVQPSLSTTTHATVPRRRSCWSTSSAHAPVRMPPYWPPAPTSPRSTWPSGVARTQGPRRTREAHCRAVT
jgi:hypothetical protein